MAKRASLQSRVLTSISITLLLFLAAVGLWLYRTGKLDSSADVAVDPAQNRVSMNFDELQLPGDKFGLAFEKQYERYGIKFHSGTEVGSNSSTYTIPALVTSAAKFDAFVNSGGVQPGGTNRPRLLQQFNGSVFTSYPNALTGGSGTSVSNLNLSPTSNIILTFHDPNDPSKPSATNYVKFNLGVAESPNLLSTVFTQTGGDISLPVGVNFLDKDGLVLGVRTATSPGTNTVEFSGPGIAKVRIFSEPTNGQQYPFSYYPSWFGIDNLSYTMPATSASANATLTTSKPSYPQGETVTATFTNTGNTTINCPSPLPLTIKSADGTVVSAVTGGRDVATINQGEARQLTWDQKNAQGAQVPAGAYVAELACTGITRSANFTITSSSQPATPDGTLTTSKPTYVPAETVSFTLKNISTVDITCPSATPFIIQDSTGATIFTPTGATVVETIVPDAQKTWTWDQKKADGTSVANGAYSVVVTCGEVRESASFTISQDAPTTLDFTVVPQQGVAPLLVTANYTGTETGLTWDFGDGTVYNDAPRTQQHTYRKAGTYTVTLRAGSRGVGSKQVVVTAPTPTTPQGGANPSLDNTTPSGPTLANTSTSTSSSTSPATLVATGGSLVINLAIAALLSVLVGWMLLRRKTA